MNGLGDRIKLMSSCLHLAEDLDVNLSVIWPKNCCGYSACCGYFDIFEKDSAERIDIEIENADSLFFHEDLQLAKFEDHATLFVCSYGFVGGLNPRESMKLMNDFIYKNLSQDILLKIDRFNLEDHVGIHVRRGDLSEDNEQQYRIVPCPDFFDRIRSDKIFLCTESMKVRRVFLEYYGEHLSFYNSEDLNRNTLSGTITALIEIMLLSK